MSELAKGSLIPAAPAARGSTVNDAAAQWLAQRDSQEPAPDETILDEGETEVLEAQELEGADIPVEDGPLDEGEEQANAELDALDFDTIANDYGIDKNRLLEIVKAKVKDSTGEELEVSLHELVPGYQRRRETEQARAEIESQRAALEAQQQERAQQFTQAEQQVAAAYHVATAQFDAQQAEINTEMARLQSIPVTSLTADQRLERQEHIEQLNWASQGLQSQRTNFEQQIQTTVQNFQQVQALQKQEAAEKSRAEARKYFPSWYDANGGFTAAANEESAAMSAHLQEHYGGSADDIGTFDDPRALALVRDSMELFRIRKAAEDAKKGKQGGPRPALPGRQTSAQFRRAKADANAEQNERDLLKKHGRPEVAASLLSKQMERAAQRRR